MNSILSVIIFSVFNFSIVCGQPSDDLFTVLAKDGDVSFRVSENDEWKPVELGTALNENHLVRVEKNAYLGLVHRSGETIPFARSGTYDIAGLQKKMSNKNSEVTQKYTKAYLQSLINPNNIIGPDATRSIENHKLKMFLPNSVDVFSPEVVLRWKDQEEITDDYEVVFRNMFDEVLMVKDASDTKLWLDFDQEPIASERLLIVSVQKKMQKDVQSSSYGIKHMTPDESALIEQELEELKLVFVEDENALDKLILASFYEQNNLLADALTCYEYAVQLSPEVEAFQTAYDQFIFRNGLGL